MTNWKLACPKCGSEYKVRREDITVGCDKVQCTCTCANCDSKFEDEIDFWAYLGLSENPIED